MTSPIDEIKILKGLVSIYSPTLMEKEAVEYCVGQMREMGYTAHIDEVGNAVGELGEGPNELLLMGHIDTVPGFIEVREDADTLWGRGSVDAKGPLASFIAAGAKAGPQFRWKTTVIGAVCEEGDSRGAKYVRDHYTPSMAVIGEPSGWEHITLGYKGSLWANFTIKRPTVHGSARGPNANEHAVDFWNRIVATANGWNIGKDKVFDQLSPTLRGMHSYTDGFFETANLKIGFRVPGGMAVEAAISLVKGLVLDGEVEFTDSIPAFRAEKNNPLVRAFLASIRSQDGKPGFLLKTGTADMNIVGPVWRCPILAYGPGDSSLDHTPQEHISLSEYRASIEILATVLKTLAI